MISTHTNVDIFLVLVNQTGWFNLQMQDFHFVVVKVVKVNKLSKLAKYASNSDWERKWAPGRGDGEVISVSVPNRLRQQRGCYATLALDLVDIDIYLIV